MNRDQLRGLFYPLTLMRHGDLEIKAPKEDCTKEEALNHVFALLEIESFVNDEFVIYD